MEIFSIIGVIAFTIFVVSLIVKSQERQKYKKYLDFYNENVEKIYAEYADRPIDDLLLDLKEEKVLKEIYTQDDDPICLFIKQSERRTLGAPERNQLALDRYSNPQRRKSLWQVGIEYERYVGYYYEQQGYKVEFHGVLKEKEDLGIDLICTKDRETLIVQCKRLSIKKKIPVRENVIAQIYGASKYYGIENKVKNIKPVIVTSYRLSEEARKFAKHLKVEVMDDFGMEEYPLIKCNISHTGNKKRYHLPFDKYYDKIVIGDKEGESYVSTVEEAMKKGFTRRTKKLKKR